MAFRVEIEPQAFEDIDSIVDHIKTNGSFILAREWFNKIIDSIASLSKMPARCPVAPESDYRTKPAQVVSSEFFTSATGPGSRWMGRNFEI